MGIGRRGVRFLEKEGDGDCLASCTQMSWFYVASFVEVCRGDLKDSANKNTVMVLNREEGLK